MMEWTVKVPYKGAHDIWVEQVHKSLPFLCGDETNEILSLSPYPSAEKPVRRANVLERTTPFTTSNWSRCVNGWDLSRNCNPPKLIRGNWDTRGCRRAFSPPRRYKSISMRCHRRKCRRWARMVRITGTSSWLINCPDKTSHSPIVSTSSSRIKVPTRISCPQEMRSLWTLVSYSDYFY